MDAVIPAELNWRSNWTVRATMNIYAYENVCVPEVLAGKDGLATNDEFSGDLLADAPWPNYERYSDAANEAARQLVDPDAPVHVSYGNVPARAYLRDISIQRGLGAHDLARFLGVPATLPPELVHDLWDALLPVVEYIRAAGVFRPEIPVPETAPLHDRLLGLTGRRP